ncbi:REXO1/REXO3 family protein [Abortiporus biennis]
MFPTLNLFQRLPCPDRPNCTRLNCLFSHNPEVVFPPTTPIPVPKASGSKSNNAAPSSSLTKATSIPVASSSRVGLPATAIPAKRPIRSPSPSRTAGTSSLSRSNEPPQKLRKVGTTARPAAVPTATHTSSGVPILRVNAAQSTIALPTRQKMLQTVYEHFVVLYKNILPQYPSLASEHALKQEEEVYKNSTKLTYRNAVISSLASLKRRPFPDSISHPSVGTQSEVIAKEEDRKKMESLRLTSSHLEAYVLSMDQMKTWGYIVEIPEGVGGDRPSEEGSIKKCERCKQPFKVKRREEADECIYHWGKAFSRTENGERRRMYSCCSRSMDDDGCERGPHVFYESDPEDLHRRHAFSFTRTHSSTDTALEVVALDCEMIYSTGGMRVARVSVVDSMGAEIFDELVRMDDGVEVIDFNTRFSGITPESYATAVLPLASIRRSLDAFISSKTIVIGHALENDLKTLRMIHHRCVDTAVMFPHKAGAPYRRALRDLVKEHLGKTIQRGGGTVGHSSVEDSIATLDLVRWRILNGPKPTPIPKPIA